jgi:thioredoxin-related protein
MSGKNWGLALRAGLAMAGFCMVAPVVAQEQTLGPKLPSVEWGSLDQALRTARQEKKAVFVMVYTDWCGYCHQMEATTFRDPMIIARLNKNFVPAKLNGESPKVLNLGKVSITETEWAQDQGVQGFPSLIVLDSKGRTVFNYPGFLTTPQTAKFLSDISDFLRGGGIDKLGNFGDWAVHRG